MARQGVFTREISQLEKIPRSKQFLTHRHTTDLPYGAIIPNFSEILMPNESLTLKTTNFLRSIPMKTPQLSRVRVFQRFVAVPMRIMWRPWEDYINAPNPGPVTPTEPYIINFTHIGEFVSKTSASASDLDRRLGFMTAFNSKAGAVSVIRSNLSQSVRDFSVLGVGNIGYSQTLGGGSVYSFSRYITPVAGAENELDPACSSAGYQFFPHELGDYLNAPVFTAHLASDVSARFSAFKFAAYQLAYNFFYRRPNVEERIDDFYEMANRTVAPSANRYLPEFRAFATNWHFDQRDSSSGGLVPPVSDVLSDIAQNKSVAVLNRTAPSGIDSTFDTDFSLESAANYVAMTSWKNCEKYVLKSGANLVMSASHADADGEDTKIPSRISLTRLRYAPWLMDRFTSANPWPQRNDESLIPVSGTIRVTLPNSTTVSFSGLSVNIPARPVSNVNAFTSENGSSFSADSVNLFATRIHTTDGAGDREILLHGRNDSGSYNYVYGTLSENVQMHVPAISGSASGSASASFSSSSANVDYALSVSPSNFRFYMQLQHIKEKSGMTDGRYKSFLSMFFGSHLSNNQLEMPQFIGGFVQDLNVSEVQQTAPTDDSPLGALAGRGVSSKRGATVRFHAVEHTVILGLIHILPDAEYIGGLNRVDHTTDPFDWPMADFAGISEQPIRLSELAVMPTTFGSTSNTQNDVAFGYEPRYNELRARHSFCTGAFRDVINSTGSREYYQPWLITRKFGMDFSTSYSGSAFLGFNYNVPSLSKEFLSSRDNVDYSNFEVTSPDIMNPFMLDSFFEESVTRIIPTRGVPRI